MTPRRSLGRRTAGRLLTALTVGFLVTAGPAAATPVPEVQGDVVGDIQVAPGSLEFVYTATGLAEGVFLDPASVQVAFGGRDLEAQAVPISDAPTQVSRTAVLTMDISGSMETDNRIGAARDAATAFLNAVPADVLVGLVTFGNDARVAVPPTTDRAQVQAAINGLGATDDFTALYDGVSVGVATAGSAGLRQVLLLTDGVNDDPTPTTSLDAVLNQVSASGVQLNAVALPGSDVATLEPVRGSRERAGLHRCRPRHLVPVLRRAGRRHQPAARRPSASSRRRWRTHPAFWTSRLARRTTRP